jgi:hypothetical protein
MLELLAQCFNFVSARKKAPPTRWWTRIGLELPVFLVVCIAGCAQRAELPPEYPALDPPPAQGAEPMAIDSVAASSSDGGAEEAGESPDF